MNSREAFEKWAKKHGFYLVRNPDGFYENPFTDGAWGGWQGAIKQHITCAEENIYEDIYDGLQATLQPLVETEDLPASVQEAVNILVDFYKDNKEREK